MLAALVAFVIVVPLTATALPFFAGRAVDGHSGAVWAIVAAATVRFVAHAGRRYLAGSLSLHIQHTLRMRVLSSLQRLDLREARRLGTGEVVSRTISDLGQIQAMASMVPLLASGCVEIAFILAVVVWMSPPVSVLVGAQVPVLAWVAWNSRKRIYAATWQAQQASADIASHVEDTVTGVRVVKSFGQEERENSALRQRARRLFALRMRVGALTARFQPALSSIPNLTLVGTIAVGGYLALHGTITVGEFLTTAAYITLLARLTRMVARMLVSVYLARAAADRVGDLLRLDARPEGHTSQPGAYGITGLDYGEIPAGSITAFTGPAGSGKTHLALALAGLDATAAAGLRTDTGTPLLELDARHRPTIVFDEAFLYSASIAENIRCGFPASAEDVRAAARLACADGFIEDVGGYGTLVGERGLTLSGGQRQRIALARAVLRNPGVLILDDATSAIDSVTEATILANLRRWADGSSRTLVIFSHRSSTLAVADRVITLPAPPAHELWPAGAPEDGTALASTANATTTATAAGSTTDTAPTTWAHLGAGPTAIPDLVQSVALPPATEEPNVRPYTEAFGLRSMVRLIPGLLAGVIATLFASVIADVTLPSLIRHAVDAGVAAGNWRTVWVTACFALAIVIVAWAVQAWNTLLTTRAGERLLYALRVRTYAHLNTLGMDWFERTSSGRILTRMTTDIDTLSGFLQTGLSQAIVSIAMVAGVLGMLVATNATLSAVVAVFVPVIALASWWFKGVSSRLYRAARSQVSQVNSTFHEAMSGLTTGQAYGYSEHTWERVAAQSSEYRRLRIRAQAAVSVFFPGISWVTELAQAAVLFIGTAMVARGEVTQGVLVAFSLYLGQFFGPVQQLSQIYDSFQQASVSLTRIRDFLAVRPTTVGGTAIPARSVTDDGISSTASGSDRDVDVQKVSFAYATRPTGSQPTAPSDAAAPSSTAASAAPTPPNAGEVSVAESSLHDLSLHFHGTTAIVGHTGAGKSTLLKLLARWYDPTQGAIRYGGRDIRDYDLPSWRRACAMVPQEPHLFAGTVASNIAYGAPDATEDQIHDAVRRVGGESVIASIPGGFHARIGSRGAGLSAGQRQIIALARAELVDPPVLLLDEATATLAEDVERAVVGAIGRASRNRTAIIVAHRLSTAATADRIVVLAHGRVVETGTHAELLHRGGSYAQLWRSAQGKHSL